jgi:MFS-type transporter involved in bile tolerance (Atg22 family)
MRFVALAGFVVALLFIAYGVWLVVTPDYDGGRRPVGAVVLALAIPLSLVSVAALNRLRRGSRH